MRVRARLDVCRSWVHLRTVFVDMVLARHEGALLATGGRVHRAQWWCMIVAQSMLCYIEIVWLGARSLSEQVFARRTSLGFIATWPCLPCVRRRREHGLRRDL